MPTHGFKGWGVKAFFFSCQAVISACEFMLALFCEVARIQGVKNLLSACLEETDE
jgi:hypothetical protein